ncbi:hypothetical protein MKW94_009836 [Papaver nudicaule]|uniref:Uncharacterized protein n=1 Tax=Papaver nudicaule TaxID=74823 RepID=A0AA41V8W9_PAPNU|nr:hypothetical protein [Papaver nudicaule]
MALKNFSKLLLSRGFSSGIRGVVTKHAVIRDDKLRSVCERLEQAAEKAKQLKDECDAAFALKKMFPSDRVIWLGIILNLAGLTGGQVQMISETRKEIKDTESQLSAIRTKRQELQDAGSISIGNIC